MKYLETYISLKILIPKYFQVTFNEKSADLPISTATMTASMATDLFLKVGLILLFINTQNPIIKIKEFNVKH